MRRSVTRLRTDYGAILSLEGIPVKAASGSTNYVAIADRLIRHLQRGGTCAVNTADASTTSYATCGLWPGSTPTLQQSNPRNQEWTLSIQLINLAASPAHMVAVYV